ncbi:MAG: YigZ family protein [Ignavibacteria bacterium]|nr:YigZ family protein [Ignavibacteria bacterium]MBT8380917.1 YigZ family protein [Ignavibacteria bacterium]MBT8391489.1 YigZ family protein [Ignavibacteria bacterium]NNJ54152.1 YigZ family protein [Ignavibacteriaceae bacterium]NNL20659.1 YigZ family protein [Ignavibacteriaceae bacterium]
MKYPEKIKTVQKQSDFTLKEKKSVFIAIVFPLSNQNEAGKHLKTLKKKYYDASHYCYAFKLLDRTQKSSDAGEPHGTAGIRILNAIDHFELTNSMVVVIRYFGGVKLGISLLGKSYYSAAYESLILAKKVTKELFQKVKIITEFEHLSIVHNLLSDSESHIEKTEHNTATEIFCLIKPSKINEIRTKIRNKSLGRVNYNPIDEYLYL